MGEFVLELKFVTDQRKGKRIRNGIRRILGCANVLSVHEKDGKVDVYYLASADDPDTAIKIFEPKSNIIWLLKESCDLMLVECSHSKLQLVTNMGGKRYVI